MRTPSSHDIEKHRNAGLETTEHHDERGEPASFTVGPLVRVVRDKERPVPQAVQPASRLGARRSDGAGQQIGVNRHVAEAPDLASQHHPAGAPAATVRRINRPDVRPWVEPFLQPAQHRLHERSVRESHAKAGGEWLVLARGLVLARAEGLGVFVQQTGCERIEPGVEQADRREAVRPKKSHDLGASRLRQRRRARRLSRGGFEPLRLTERAEVDVGRKVPMPEPAEPRTIIGEHRARMRGDIRAQETDGFARRQIEMRPIGQPDIAVCHERRRVHLD